MTDLQQVCVNKDIRYEPAIFVVNVLNWPLLIENIYLQEGKIEHVLDLAPNIYNTTN